MYVCMHVCMNYVCMYVCNSARYWARQSLFGAMGDMDCVSICMYYEGKYVSMHPKYSEYYICMYACLYVCMYVLCMYVCTPFGALFGVPIAIRRARWNRQLEW